MAALANCMLDTLKYKQETWQMSKGKATQTKRIKVTTNNYYKQLIFPILGLCRQMISVTLI